MTPPNISVAPHALSRAQIPPSPSPSPSPFNAGHAGYIRYDIRDGVESIRYSVNKV